MKTLKDYKKKHRRLFNFASILLQEGRLKEESWNFTESTIKEILDSVRLEEKSPHKGWLSGHYIKDVDEAKEWGHYSAVQELNERIEEVLK